jgi:hypothetical protein
LRQLTPEFDEAATEVVYNSMERSMTIAFRDHCVRMQLADALRLGQQLVGSVRPITGPIKGPALTQKRPLMHWL